METRNMTRGMETGTYPGASQQSDLSRVKEDLKQQGEVMRDEARAASQQLKGAAADAGRQVKEKAGDVAHQAQRKVAQYARQAQTHGQTMLDQQREKVAGQMQTVGEAVRRAAEKFREDKDDNIAGYVDAAADEVQRLGQYLQRRDLGSLWRDAQQFGRRRPEWFLGGMFVAGLALTRFLKASAERHESYPRSDYQGEDDYGAETDPASAMYAGTSGLGDDPMARLPDPSQATQQDMGSITPGSSSGSGSSGSTGIPVSDTTTAVVPGLSTPGNYPSSTGQA